MDNNYIDFQFGDYKIKVPNGYIKELNALDITFDEDYIINYLLKFIYPKQHIQENDITQLIYYDYSNRVIFSRKKGWGLIVEYDKNAVIVNKYSSVMDAVLSKEKKTCFGFEIFDEKAGKPEYKKDLSFFGLSFSGYYCINSDYYSYAFRTLNTDIDFIRRNLINLDKHKKQIALYTVFSEAFKLLNMLHSELWKRRVSRIKLSESVYKEVLLAVKKRYSLYDECMLESVRDLNDYDCPGIYFLAFDSFKSYYIGQSRLSIKKRIMQHFRQPKSDFDKSYGANEISAIYVIKYLSNEKEIDELEADAIAMVPQEHLMNCLAGSGKTIRLLVSIHDEEYNPSDYLMKKTRLKKALSTMFELKHGSDKRMIK